ncbi:MAG: hypothetical protein JJ992_09060 [Planctomycetes bacterium]|nr:hypothetical protein [Planctomycetota bacterium]
MTRAGREPAEDVKRRLVAVCQEVGLTIQNANMIRQPMDGSRLILVGAIPEGWSFDTPMLSLMASVSASGDWTRKADVRCVAADGECDPGHAPWMQGRNAVALGELIEQLRETLSERDQVLAAVKAGIAGPYEFKQTVWTVVDLMADFDPFRPAE